MTGKYVVEYESDWADYPTWEEFERVDSVEDGEALITSVLNKDYERALANWLKQKPRADQSRDLFERRKAVLESAGLWKQDGESFIPLLGPPNIGPEPVRGDRSNWRVRAAAEVDAE